MNETAIATRAGFVALIGAPNAGKSTLVNRLVGTKVSIVSHKVQTTRALVRGIALKGEAQIVLVDTPGIFRPKRRLDRAKMSSGGSSGASSCLASVIGRARGSRKAGGRASGTGRKAAGGDEAIRGYRAAVMGLTSRRRSSSSTRRESSDPSAASIAPWCRPPGAAPRMPTSS